MYVFHALLWAFILKASSGIFDCSQPGRFSDPQDPTCSQYYLCTRLQNFFIKNKYKCGNEKRFDPSTEECSLNYRCCSSTTVSFECTRTGRFRKVDDLSCRRYYLCTQLGQNIFIKHEFSCPVGTFFDESLQDCDKNYQCPCSLTTSKIKSASITIKSTSATTKATTKITTATTKTTATSTFKSLTTALTTTAITLSKTYFFPTIMQNSQECGNTNEDFVCTKKGRFKEPNDTTCTTYFLCSLLWNGSFIQTKYSCPLGSFFDPEIEICNIAYQCPCTVLPTTLETTTSDVSCIVGGNSFTCSEEGRFVNPNDKNCITYFLCSLLQNGSLIQTKHSCPLGSWFDPSLQICSISYQCPCYTTTTELPETSTTEMSTTQCASYKNYTQDFICSEKGRFLNPRDESCTTYFLCSLLRNGSFIQTEYSCPLGSWFDPELQICSISYQCPCSTTTTVLPETSTTEMSTTQCAAYKNHPQDFTCSEKGRFINPRDASCTTYFLCSLLRNGSFIQTEYSCPLGSWFDPALQICSISYQCPCSTTTTELPETSTTEMSTTQCAAYKNYTQDFICSEKGRFINQRDESCTTYFLCSLLRNGSFIQTEYSCPLGSWFDPALQICSISYQCPCSTTTTEFPETSTTEMSTTQCAAYKNHPQDFTCSEKGRFINPRDASCTTYFLCSLLRNGSFIQTEYSCPLGSWFDPALQICSISYQCPCSTTTTKLPETSTTEMSTTQCAAYKNYTQDFICSEKGRFINQRDESCTTYFLCSLLRNGSFIQTEYSCPLGSWFDPALQICSISYQCPCSTTTTELPETSTNEMSTTQCAAYKNYTQNFTCSEKGRFLNPRDESCTTYFLCSFLRNGSFIQTEYSCPLGSWFDPALQICSISYQCPCSTTTTEFPETSTTEMSTTQCAAYKNHPQDFTCSEKGRFLNPRDETCTTYFLCSLLRNGSFIQTEYSCPLGSWFDPALQICSISYQCPCSTTTTELPETSTTEMSTTQCAAYKIYTQDFTCSEKGRFLNPRDESCTTYFLCSLLRNGSFIQTEYSCPLGSWFDPALQICSISYQCPCSTTTTELPETSTTEMSTTQCAAYKNYTQDFICSEKGRFINQRDESCTTYFLCSLLRNGSFIQTEYSCPLGSWFDPALQICSISYQCPCSTTTTELPETSTTEMSTTQCAAYKNYTQHFTCSEKGRFLNPRDESCTTYFLCSLLRNGSFIQTEYSCPLGSWFDPELQICSISYQCPCSTTTTVLPETSTTEMSTTQCAAYKNHPQDFTCSEKGRFLNPRDESCTTYFLCSLLRNGSFIQTEYSCPLGSWFDPELQICSISYQCPCSTTTTVLPERSTTEMSTTQCAAYKIYTQDFTCSEKGRFINPRDESCTTYFLCSLLRNGSFIQTEYSCPLESWFDPALQICSISYQCPCSTTTTELPETSTTEMSTTQCAAYKIYTQDFTCSEKGRFLNPRDESCTTYFLCSLLRNGSFIQTEYSCPLGSWFDPELQICSISYQCPCSTTTTVLPETSTTEMSTTQCAAYKIYTQDFTCSEKGRFINPRDESCTTYFLCSLLRNGSFIQTEYSCPLGSWFDPALQICSISYQCPCSTTTTELPETSTTEMSTTQCAAYKNYTQDFICSEKGRFLNPRDESCTTYFLCSLLRNGSFIQTEYSCPLGSWFDPALQICSISYQCPCSTTTIELLETSTTEMSTTQCAAYKIYTQNFTCSEKGRFLNPRDETCTTYFLCSLLRNGSFIQTEYSCPLGSWFDPALQICSISYQCPCSTTTTELPETSTTEMSTTQCAAYKNYTQDFICSEKGRFINQRDESCTTYFLCSLLRNGSFIQTEYSCPLGSWFDPALQICSISYQCPCSTTTTELPETSTTEMSTTQCAAYKNYTQHFTCSEKGRFLNPRDESCTTYFLCSLLRNGSFIQTEYSCPLGSWFDPELQICSISYQCPCSTTTTVLPETSTTEMSTTQCAAYKNHPQDFTCSEKGRFLNPRDESCTTYFLCSLLRNGSFIQTEYSCSLGSWFDPELQICSISYQCPCSTTVTTVPTTTSNCNDHSTTAEFICSEKGRFPNKKNLSCSSYYLCNLLRNGTFIQTEYFCPHGSFFDPELQICSIEYNCLCMST